MKKILFVCHGNICRSPMAQFLLQQMVNDRGLAEKYRIDSCATSCEELGNGIYPPARNKLLEKGVPLLSHTARQLTKRDYRENDLLIGMDSRNLANMERMLGGDPEGKIRLLLSFAGENRAVADPWYTGDFETAFRDIKTGCEALLSYLQDKTIKKEKIK